MEYKIKYGSITNKQMDEIKHILHKEVFKLLCLKEEKYQELDVYFESVLWKISGYNSLFETNTYLLELLSVIEQARVESLKENYNHRMYRKAILDGMSLISKISN